MPAAVPVDTALPAATAAPPTPLALFTVAPSGPMFTTPEGLPTIALVSGSVFSS
jgi:hypothetical protein